MKDFILNLTGLLILPILAVVALLLAPILWLWVFYKMWREENANI